MPDTEKHIVTEDADKFEFVPNPYAIKGASLPKIIEILTIVHGDKADWKEESNLFKIEVANNAVRHFLSSLYIFSLSLL